MNPLWRIELFGWLRLVGADRVITRFRTQKVAALLAYLAYHAHRSHPRELLIELLWPGSDPRAGSVNLRTAIASARRQLEPPGVPAGAVLIANRDCIRLNPDVCETDVARFETALKTAARRDALAQKAQRLAEAAELYRGELLPGYFDDWVLAERQRLLESYLKVLSELAESCEAASDGYGALQWARRAVVADPLREEAHQRLIRLLTAAGQPESALRQYRDLERLLRVELQAAPEAALRALARELEAQVAAVHRVDRPRHEAAPMAPIKSSNAGTPANPVTPSTAPLRPCARPEFGGSVSLPPQFTRYFGREGEITRVNRLAGDPDTGRLVTLTGPGGTGKTRLAQEAAARVQEKFGGTVGFVSLVDLTEPSLIPGQILNALRVLRSPELPPFEQVVAVLSATGSPERSRRQTLLVLDNLEHLLPEGAAVIQALLERVVSLLLWVTSRQSLGLPGEQELAVGPLPVPVPGARCPVPGLTVSPPDTGHWTLSTVPSVTLFVDRAQAVRPDFQLTAANAPGVARLCAALEGLPLAIELAAARIGALTPAQMLARLEEREGALWAMLTSRRRLPDRRHRSLRAALDWSYHLLSPELQRFFGRLSVFRGGWTLEAAEAICGSNVRNSLDLLEQLRECSLIVAEEGLWGMRYRLLETLREYGRGRLREAGEADTISERHARFFLDLVERAEPELMGSQQAEWIGRLDEEYDNVRAALSWDQARQDDHDTGLRLVGALFWFWWVRCYLGEGAGWGRGVLARTGGAPGVPPLEAPAPEPDRTWARAKACRCTGGMLWAQGKHEEARVLMEEGVVIARERGDPGQLAHTLRFLGWVALDQRDYRVARSVVEESLALFRTIGDQVQIGRSLNILASLLRVQGDYESAEAWWEETVAVSREAGDPWAVAIGLANLGKLAEHRGDREAARSHFQQSLLLRRAIKDVRGIAECLEGVAALACGDAEMERAARLFGAAEAAHEAVSAPPLMAFLPAGREAAVALVRGALAPAAFATAWAQGRALPLEAAVAEALREDHRG
jgi:predicted ATPase/DNA-binding SARP family transcriptional activator